MEKIKFALVIGHISDKRKQERIFYCDKEFVPAAAQWAMDMAKKNQLVFDSEEDVIRFRDEVTEFAKTLYKEKYQ